jgi:histidinol-phosphate phosphatase family protein
LVAGQPAVFFDRDGTLSEMHPAGHAPWRFEDFRLVEGAADLVERIVEAGFLVFVVTNQPDVLDGYLSIDDLTEMHRSLASSLRIVEISVALDRSLPTYKPGNAMIEELIEKYDVDRSRSYMVGDSWKDVAAGKKSQLKTVLIDRGYDERIESFEPDLVVEKLDEAVSKIVESVPESVTGPLT